MLSLITIIANKDPIMISPINKPFVTSLKKHELLFTSSACESELFTVNTGTSLLDQTSVAINQLIQNCEQHGMTKHNLLKLVVYYVDDGSTTRSDLRDFIARQLDCELLPVMTFVPLSQHHQNQSKIVIEAVGMQFTAPLKRLLQVDSVYSQAIRCGEIIFIGAIDAYQNNQIQYPGDIVKQSHIVLKKLDSILDHFGACKNDVVKINNWYVAGGSAEQWSQSAQVRASYYPEPGPVATGLPVKSLGIEELQIQTDCWVMIDAQDQTIDKQFSWPADHWDWPIHLPFKHGLKCRDLIFTGGQVSMDNQANVIDPDDIIRQSHTSMNNIAAVLNEFNAKLADIVKVTAFYQSRKEPDDLMENLAIRASYFNHTKPQSTSIPLDYLAYQGMLTEFEIIAVDSGSSTQSIN